MTFLPIVERELRSAARQPATYWIRSAAALSVLLLWLCLLLSSRRATLSSLGHNIFIAFGLMALAFCLVAGIFLTADCLSEEKREGTLGLLFLTDLRGYDVVLGKLIGSSVRSTSGLVAIFPIIGLPLLMGGVTRGEFWRIVAALLAALILSLSLGMFVSSINREARQAMAGTFLGLLVVGGVLPMIWWVATALHQTWPVQISLCTSPVYLFSSALESHYRTKTGPDEFWLSLLIVMLLSILFLLAAAIFLQRAWQEGKVIRKSGEAFLRLPGVGVLQSLAFRSFSAARSLLMKQSRLVDGVRILLAMVTGLATGLFVVTTKEGRMPWATCALFAGAIYVGMLIVPRIIRARAAIPNRKQIMEQSPFYWLATRDKTSKAVTWAIILFLTLLWIGFLVTALVSKKPEEAFTFCLIAAYALHQAFKMMLAIEANRQIWEARRNGNLELLLVSRLEERSIIEEHAQALKATFFGVRRFVVCINVIMCLAILLSPEALSMNSEAQGIFLEMFLGGILMATMDFRTISATGMLMALRFARLDRAVLATLARVMGLPWAAIFVIVFLGFAGALNGIDQGTVITVWFGIAIVTNLAVSSETRWALARGIRASQESELPKATQRPTSVPPFRLAGHACETSN